MEQIRESVKVAFDLISSIPVSGNSVELMAAAKEHLRKAYNDLGQMKEKEKKKNEKAATNG